MQLQYAPDIPENILHEIKLNHAHDKHLIDLVAGDELLVEVLVLDWVVLVLVVHYFDLLHFVHGLVDPLDVDG